MKGSKIAVGAIVGAAAGVIAGLLTAPKSGRETREDILRKAGEVKDSATAKKDGVLFKVEEVAYDLRNRATDTIDTLKTRKQK